MVAPALISAGASLLGGLFGRNSQKKAQARQNEYDKPINIRARYEEGGFNPLLGIANANPQQNSIGWQPIMGNAIASAGMAYAGAMRDKQQLDLEKQRLQLQTKELDELLKRQTIRPKIGGVYASNQLTPSRGGVGSPAIEGISSGLPLNKLRPPTRPDLFSKGLVPVFGIGGEEINIPQRHADRLDIQPFDTLLMEDYEAFYGDEVGQVIGLPQTPQAQQNIEGGLFNRSLDDRKGRAERPWSPLQYFNKSYDDILSTRDSKKEAEKRKKERLDALDEQMKKEREEMNSIFKSKNPTFKNIRK